MSEAGEMLGRWGTLDAREDRVSRRGGGTGSYIPDGTEEPGPAALPEQLWVLAGLRARREGTRGSQAPEPVGRQVCELFCCRGRWSTWAAVSREEARENRGQVSPRTADASGDDPVDKRADSLGEQRRTTLRMSRAGERGGGPLPVRD